MEDKDYERVISHVNRIIDNLNQHWHSITLLLSHVSKPLLVDDRGLANVLKQFKESMNEFMFEFSKLDVIRTFGEIKYIGNRLCEIEKILFEFKKDGFTKNIDLNFTVDGYQLVKKPIGYEPDQPIEEPNNDLRELLNTLSNREAQAIIHRVGLFGQKKKTYEELGKRFGITKKTARLLFNKAIRKLRHPSRKELADKITHPGLRKEVFG